MKLDVLTWNTLFAGRDGADDRRAHAQVEVIKALAPDVFLMQEGRGFDQNGAAWLYALEAAIEMRGFLAVAPRTGQHTAIFVRAPLRPLAFDADGANFHHALATLTVTAPGLQQSLKFMSAHLCPNGAEVRRREAAYLSLQPDPQSLCLLAGDFNSVSPHDHEPPDFAQLPPHHRARYLDYDGRDADRTVLARLEAAGWIDVAHTLGAHQAPTVPAAAFKATEFATMRCDYMMVSRPLAAGARSCRVIRTPLTDTASDHYPVLASFELAAA